GRHRRWWRDVRRNYGGRRVYRGQPDSHDRRHACRVPQQPDHTERQQHDGSGYDTEPDRCHGTRLRRIMHTWLISRLTLRWGITALCALALSACSSLNSMMGGSSEQDALHALQWTYA